jgi:multiple sugar transport system substrate-binding protein
MNAMTNLGRSAALLLIAGLLMGCGSVDAKPIGGSVRVLATWEGAERDAFIKMLEPFEQQTGINVNVQLVGWDVQYQRITNAAISGEAPDVTQAGTTQVPYFAALGGFENLASRVNRIGGRSAYAPGVWATTQLAGRPGVWSVPWFTEARTIYYRKDVYRRAGVNPATAFKTWASFRSALLKLRSVRSVNGRPIMPFGQPGKTAWDLVHHIMPFVWGAGGRELAGTRQSAIDSAAAIRMTSSSRCSA